MYETIAMKLYFGNFGLPMKEPYAKREGQMRARDREERAWRDRVGHPGLEIMTRQRRRQAAHLRMKKFRSVMKLAKDKKNL